MKDIKKVAVLGAGMMGAEIAFCCALAGYGVLLKETTLELAEKGKERIKKVFADQVKKGRLTFAPEEVEQKLALITPADTYDGIENVDLVIEAVIENIAIKKKVFQEIDTLCKKDCIFASNTSSISITELSSSTTRPDKFIGMHFFSPASVMKLVEIIPGLDTSADTVDFAFAVAKAQGKEPIRLKECVGFVVNRILEAMIIEAIRIVEEGVATPEDIDKAMRLGCGHPIGPFQMLDLIGLDLNLEVMNILYDAYGERFRPPSLIKRKVSAGHLGRKVKRGWFDYRK